MNWPERDPVVIRRLSVGGLVLAVLLLFLMINSYLQSKPENEKPKLGLMSSLPLRWSEGGIRAEIDGTATPAPAYDRLAQDYRIQLIDDIADLKRRKITLLLLAQPRGLSPSALFDLDQWVRSGGHVFILADPALQWESDFPIGDTRRPLFTSLLSPLLSHWGVELVMPMEGSEALTVRTLDGMHIRTTSPGAWQEKVGKSNAACQISADFLRADCSVGRGKAVLFADADILDARHWEATGVRRLGGGDDFANMDWLMQELVKLQSVSQ